MRIMLASFVGGLLVLGAFVTNPDSLSGISLSLPSFEGGASALTAQVSAATSPIVPCGNTGQPACQACHLVVLGQNVIKFGVFISVLISAVMFAVAGFLYLTSAGAEHQLEEARSIFTNVFIGLLLVLLSWLIVDTIMKTLFVGSQLSQLGPWNEVQCNSSINTVLAPPGTVPTTVSPSVRSGSASTGNVGVGSMSQQQINANLDKTQKYNVEIARAAASAGIDPDVLRATLAIEGGSPNSVSRVGSQTVVGVGQMTTATARQLDPALSGLSDSAVVSRLQDPAYNIGLSAQLLKQINGNPAVYNGGPGAIAPSKDCPGLLAYQCTVGPNNFAETRNYVPNFQNTLQTIKTTRSS